MVVVSANTRLETHHLEPSKLIGEIIFVSHHKGSINSEMVWTGDPMRQIRLRTCSIPKSKLDGLFTGSDIDNVVIALGRGGSQRWKVRNCKKRK